MLMFTFMFIFIFFNKNNIFKYSNYYKICGMVTVATTIGVRATVATIYNITQIETFSLSTNASTSNLILVLVVYMTMCLFFSKFSMKIVSNFLKHKQILMSILWLIYGSTLALTHLSLSSPISLGKSLYIFSN